MASPLLRPDQLLHLRRGEAGVEDRGPDGGREPTEIRPLRPRRARSFGRASRPLGPRLGPGGSALSLRTPGRRGSHRRRNVGLLHILRRSILGTLRRPRTGGRSRWSNPVRPLVHLLGALFSEHLYFFQPSIQLRTGSGCRRRPGRRLSATCTLAPCGVRGRASSATRRWAAPRAPTGFPRPGVMLRPLRSPWRLRTSSRRLRRGAAGARGGRAR